jgi:hypothetical protein
MPNEPTRATGLRVFPGVPPKVSTSRNITWKMWKNDMRLRIPGGTRLQTTIRQEGPAIINIPYVHNEK